MEDERLRGVKLRAFPGPSIPADFIYTPELCPNLLNLAWSGRPAQEHLDLLVL